MSSVKQSLNGRGAGSVLIVNDLPEQLSLMDTLLRKAGFAVLTAVDGQEALEVAKRERPDLVISDVTMPRLRLVVILEPFLKLTVLSDLHRREAVACGGASVPKINIDVEHLA